MSNPYKWPKINGFHLGVLSPPINGVMFTPLLITGFFGGPSMWGGSKIVLVFFHKEKFRWLEFFGWFEISNKNGELLVWMLLF